MRLKWKLVWMIILVLLGLSIVTGAAYAFYRYFSDAGMQSASEVGLVSTVNVTAQPTRNPTATPPEPVTAIGETQTLEGVSMTLDWVYLMDGQQAFGFSAQGLVDGKSLGMPEMGFGQLVPQQYRGAGMAVKNDVQPVTGTYVVNQIVRDENTYGKTDTYTDVSIDIPLVDGDGQVLNTFRFEVKNELVHSGPSSGGNTYSTRANSLEMSLDWVILTSKATQARLCFISPDGKDWNLVSPTIQLAADPNQLASTAPIASSGSTVVITENGVRCQQVTFPGSLAGAQAFYLKVSKLSTSSGETMTGDWSFNWNQLPDQMQFPGIAPLAAPLGSNEIGSNMTVTLEKAYADVDRMVFVVFIKSSQQGLVVSYVTLKDSNGADVNTGGGITSPPDDPSRFVLELDPETSFLAGQFKGQLVVGIGNQYGPGSSQAEAHFFVDLTVYPAITFDLMQTITANGVEMLLQKIEQTPSFTQVYLCFQKPSPADWTILDSASLQIGEDSAAPSRSVLLFDSESRLPAQAGWSSPVKKGRCEKVGFPVGHHNQAEIMTLTISELEQSMPEVIPNDQLQSARQKLLARGIDMDWVTFSGNGGGGGGPEIKKKPDGMTDDQVMRLFYEIMGYYYPGPWTFTAQIKP